MLDACCSIGRCHIVCHGLCAQRDGVDVVDICEHGVNDVVADGLEDILEAQADEVCHILLHLRACLLILDGVEVHGLRDDGCEAQVILGLDDHVDEAECLAAQCKRILRARRDLAEAERADDRVDLVGQAHDAAGVVCGWLSPAKRGL